MTVALGAIRRTAFSLGFKRVFRRAARQLINQELLRAVGGAYAMNFSIHWIDTYNCQYGK
jgi:hypothetical protein